MNLIKLRRSVRNLQHKINAKNISNTLTNFDPLKNVGRDLTTGHIYKAKTNKNNGGTTHERYVKRTISRYP